MIDLRPDLEGWHGGPDGLSDCYDTLRQRKRALRAGSTIYLQYRTWFLTTEFWWRYGTVSAQLHIVWSGKLRFINPRGLMQVHRRYVTKRLLGFDASLVSVSKCRIARIIRSFLHAS